MLTLLKAFLRALFRHWLSMFLFLLAFGSTLATYMPGFIPNFSVPRWLPLVFVVLAWFMGSFDLFRIQTSEIERLTSENRLLRNEAKRAALVIEVYPGSAFLRHVPDRETAVGVYLHIRASVENKGSRASVISKYHLSIRETGTDEVVEPHGFSSVQGPSFTWGIETARKNLALDGFIRIPPDSLAGPDILPFYVTAVPPHDCHLLHCRLTVTDSNGEQAGLDFELQEHM